MRSILGLAVLVGLAHLASYPVHAQEQGGATTGARLLRQTEQKPQIEQDVKPREEVQVQEPNEVVGPEVLVSEFSFSGNTLFGDDALREPLDRFIGKKASLAELRYAADLVAKYYQDRGYLVRANLAPQEIIEGNVRINLTEGQLEEVAVEGADDEKALRRVSDIARGGLRDGQILDLRRVERGALLLNRLPGQSYRTVLRAGLTEGGSAVVVVPQKVAAKQFSVSLDSNGSARAGQARLTATASLYPIAGFGDEISVSVLASRGVQYTRASYTKPVGDDGLLASVAVSALRYDLLGTPLEIQGDSQAIEGRLVYPLVLQADKNVFVSFDAGYRRFSDRVESESTDRSLASGTAAVDITSADNMLGGGLFTAGVSAQLGQTINQATFTTIVSYIGRRHKIGESNTLDIKLTGQLGSGSIDPSQAFIVNGTSGVLGFGNDDDVSGRSGLLFHAGIEHAINNRIRGSVFYDHAKVYGVAANRPTRLQSVGVNAQMIAINALSVDATLALPINAPIQFKETLRAWISARIVF